MHYLQIVKRRTAWVTAIKQLIINLIIAQGKFYNTKITLLEKYKSSEDAILHADNFENGPNFEKFFKMFINYAPLNNTKLFAACTTKHLSDKKLTLNTSKSVV